MQQTGNIVGQKYITATLLKQLISCEIDLS